MSYQAQLPPSHPCPLGNCPRAVTFEYAICMFHGRNLRARHRTLWHELTTAYRKGIRVYMVTEIPATEISGWVLACTYSVFGNLEELKSFLASTYGKDARQQALWK